MADGPGQIDLRGVDYTKLNFAYLEQALVFKGDLTGRTTKNEQFIWFQETALPLSMTAPTSTSVAAGALPWVTQNTATKNTTNVKFWMIDSPYIALADLKDNEVNIWEMQSRALTNLLKNDIDTYIWGIVSENVTPSTINSVTSTAAWDAGSGQDPIEDIEEAKMDIKDNSGYDPETNGGKLYVNSYDYKSLIKWLISTKGSSWTEYASAQLTQGAIMRLRGLDVKRTNAVTTDYAMVAIPQLGGSWYSFKDMETSFIEEPQVGRKMRLGTAGAATLDRPKCWALISNTKT